MEHKILIYYRNAYAHYKVAEDTEGIYTVELLNYEGDQKNCPCTSATVLKGFKRWYGCDDKELLKLLAEAIQRATEAPFIMPDQDQQTA